MTRRLRPRDWIWVVLGLAVIVVGLALAVEFRLTRASATPLWTEKPVAATSAKPVEAPPWVVLALKPAVLNISTKRVEPGGPELSEQSGDGGTPFDQFFKRFFGRVPPRTVRSLGSGFLINPSGYRCAIRDGAHDEHHPRGRLALSAAPHLPADGGW